MAIKLIGCPDRPTSQVCACANVCLFESGPTSNVESSSGVNFHIFPMMNGTGLVCTPMLCHSLYMPRLCETFRLQLEVLIRPISAEAPFAFPHLAYHLSDPLANPLLRCALQSKVLIMKLLTEVLSILWW